MTKINVQLRDIVVRHEAPFSYTLKRDLAFLGTYDSIVQFP